MKSAALLLTEAYASVGKASDGYAPLRNVRAEYVRRQASNATVACQQAVDKVETFIKGRLHGKPS